MTVMGLIQDSEEKAYREEVELFRNWYNSLILNVEKTKEILIDFTRKQPIYTPIYISSTRNFPGVHVPGVQDLTQSLHASSLVEKAHK